MKRFTYSVMGLALIGLVVWFYFRAEAVKGLYILLFGLGSAILVPLGIWLIAYAIRAKREDALAQLTKIPQVEDLLKEAKTQEEKITALKQEYRLLESRVRIESERLALEARKRDLQTEAERVVDDWNAIDVELDRVAPSSADAASHHVRELQKRLDANRAGHRVIRIGSRRFTIPSTSRDLLDPVSFAMAVVIAIVNEMSREIMRLGKRNRE